MAIVILPFLAVLTVAAIAYTQGQEDRFPIIAYQGLRRAYFDQMTDCNFNAVFNWSVDENDFTVADAMGLHLISAIHTKATSGQWSRYESDKHAAPPDVMEHFYHDVIGREVEDPNPDTLSNQWAWVAQVSSDTAGWMQRGCLFSWEQNIPTYWYWGPGDTLWYYAHFRMRLASDAVAPDSVPIATIDAVRIFSGDTTLMAEDSLWYSDFDTAGALGQYADFTISFLRTKDDSGTLDYRVYWYGNLDLWVDRVVLEDERYRTLMAGGYDDAIWSRVSQYSDHNSLFRWYLWDEPHRDQFPANAYLRVYLDTITNPQTVPGVQAVHRSPLSYPDYLLDYLDVVNPNELTYDRYPIESTADSATDVDSNSLQIYWGDLFLPHIKKVKEIAKNSGKPFWYYPQAFEHLIDTTGNWELGSRRYPTNNELKCNVWLSLCCGAQGLFYYRYASYLRGPSGEGDPSDTLYYPEGQGTFASKGESWIGGLVRWNGSTWVKVETYPGDTLWNAVRDMNAVVDSVGDLLLSLTWLDEGRWDEVSTLSGSYITSITSNRYPQDSVWVEVGFFEDDLYDYFMLVNRRCLSTETQTVTATLQLSPGECYTIKDVYAGDETILFNETGTVDFTTTLGPGQGKLFRLRQGAYLTTHHTWSGTDTFHCDLIIAPSGTLTIMPGTTLKFASGTKLAVEGALVAEGTADSNITLAAVDTAHRWHGIEFTDESDDNSCVLRHCVIEWATIGVCCNSASPTLDDNLIQCCSESGIQCTQASPIITNNTVRLCLNGAEFYSSSPLLEGNHFNYNDVSGIELFNSYGTIHIIQDNYFDYNDLYGMWLDGYSSPTTYRCTVRGNDDIGVVCINHSSPHMDSCLVWHNGGTGIHCSNYSSPILSFRPRIVGYPEGGYNQIIENGGCGVSAAGSSYPDLGYLKHSPPYPGNNSIYNNADYEVSNGNSSGWVWAQSNYWGRPPRHPDSSDFYGLVVWEPYLTRDPNQPPIPPPEPLSGADGPSLDSTRSCGVFNPGSRGIPGSGSV